MARPARAALRTQTTDLLVVGSGAGALSAAVTAAHLGLQVTVIEKSPWLGGTTAWSGGWMWIPHNPLARAAGIHEDAEPPRTYLRAILGDAAFDAGRARLDAFLAHGPDMVAFHQAHTALRFIDGNSIPDFHGHAPGACEGGRSVCAAPFDAAALGPLLPRLRPPRDILSFLGMSIGSDLRHFQRAPRAADSARYVAGRILRHGLDLTTHGHGRLRMGGNALVAALLASAQARGVDLRTGHTARELLRGGLQGCTPGGPAADHTPGGPAGRVRGARVDGPQGTLQILARHGVVLACGGFPHDRARIAAWFTHAPTGTEHHSAAPQTNTGDGLRLAEAVGAALDAVLPDAGAWAPVSLVPRPDGSTAAFPHLVERGKPGLIAVDARGERFVDEAGNYHSFMRALFARTPAGSPVQAWLIADHRFQRRYGLGASKPWPFALRGWLASGYLVRAGTPDALAARCGIAADGLSRTIACYNAAAAHGRDPDFGRGETPYDRMQGDAEHDGPNRCVAPIVTPPYYAVRVVPGSLGTFAGLKADAHARVLDTHDRPIEGLYVAGNDMASIMAGHYPSGGITLGPAMTFGYILAHHAAGRPLAMPAEARVARAA